MSKAKFYVGRAEGGVSEMFTASETPTQESHGDKYRAVIGPFRTRQGAMFMAKYGVGNPHLQHVEDAERLAREESKKHQTARSTGKLSRAIDEHAARDLLLFAQNERDLYNQRRSIEQNMEKKILDGKFDLKLSAKLWRYWIDRAAKCYRREHQGVHLGVPERDFAATQMAAEFAKEWSFDKVIPATRDGEEWRIERANLGAPWKATLPDRLGGKPILKEYAPKTSYKFVLKDLKRMSRSILKGWNHYEKIEEQLTETLSKIDKKPTRALDKKAGKLWSQLIEPMKEHYRMQVEMRRARFAQGSTKKERRFGSRFVKKGTRVVYKSSGAIGTLLEDARIGPEAGLDMYDVQWDDGDEGGARGVDLLPIAQGHKGSKGSKVGGKEAALETFRIFAIGARNGHLDGKAGIARGHTLKSVLVELQGNLPDYYTPKQKKQYVLGYKKGFLLSAKKKPLPQDLIDAGTPEAGIPEFKQKFPTVDLTRVREGQRTLGTSEIHAALVDAHVPVDHHESDLYAKVTRESTALIERYIHKNQVKSFIDNVRQERWYDIPFAYNPKLAAHNIPRGHGERREKLLHPPGALSGPPSGFGKEATKEDFEGRIAWEKWAAKEARSKGHEAAAQGHDLARAEYEKLATRKFGGG